MPEVLAEIPVGAARRHDLADDLCDLDRRVAVYAERRVADPEAGGMTMVATDGHRLSMVEHSVELSGIAGASCAAAAQGDERDPQAGRRRRRRHQNPFLGRRQSPVLSARRPPAAVARKLTGNFPDFERVLPKDHPIAMTLQRDELRGGDRTRVPVRRRTLPGDPGSVLPWGAEGSFLDLGDRRKRRERARRIRRRHGRDRIQCAVPARFPAGGIASDRCPSDSRIRNSAGELRPRRRQSGRQYRYVVMPMRI